MRINECDRGTWERKKKDSLSTFEVDIRCELCDRTDESSEGNGKDVFNHLGRRKVKNLVVGCNRNGA